MSSGFEVFALDHARDIRTIRKKLEMIRARCCEDILSGSVSDWADYQRRVGVLDGIDQALQACGEIERAERA